MGNCVDLHDEMISYHTTFCIPDFVKKDTNVPTTPLKKNKFKKDKVQISPNHDPFFVQVRVKQHEKVASWFLFTPEYVELFHDSTTRIEVFPDSTEVYVDQKHIYVRYRDVEVVLFIIGNRTLLQKVFFNRSETPTHTFIYCMEAAGYQFPALHYVSTRFFSKSIYTIHFLMSFAYLETPLGTYTEYFNAILPNFEYIVSQILQKDLAPISLGKDAFLNSCVSTALATAVVSADMVFSRTLTQMSKYSFDEAVHCYIKQLRYNHTINPVTKLFFYLVYKKAFQKFNSHRESLTVLASMLFNGCIKNTISSDISQKLKPLHEFRFFGDFDFSTMFIQSLEALTKFPTDYAPIDVTSLQMFALIDLLSMIHDIDFKNFKAAALRCKEPCIEIGRNLL